MEATANFICRQYVGGDRDYSAHMRRVHPWAWECKCPRTVECEWQGDERGATLMDAESVLHFTGHERMSEAIGREFVRGGVRLKVVDICFHSGAYCDAFTVMLAHNPHAQLQSLYRPAARWLLRKCVRFEARIRGFLLQPTEGRVMAASKWMADRLL